MHGPTHFKANLLTHVVVDLSLGMDKMRKSTFILLFCSFPRGTSLVSKVVLLSEYRHVCQRLKIQPVTSDMSYYNLKQTAKEYHQKKRAMIAYLEQKKFGYWSHEKKHLEQFRWQSTIPPIQRNITM